MSEDWINTAKSRSEMSEIDDLTINFLKDKEEIENTFLEICKPLEGLYKIEINKNNYSITICDKTYILDIKEYVISILYGSKTDTSYRYYQKFTVFEDKGIKMYTYASRRTSDEEQFLLKSTLNYKRILNNLMDRAIINKR